MAGERSYVQIPPDSTGKQISHAPWHRLGYTTRIGNHIWRIGEQYTVNRLSGSPATITVTVFTGTDSDTGQIGVLFNNVDEYANVELASGDTILYDGSTVATLTFDEIIFSPATKISGGDNPENTANVDRTGSMNIRFADGRPQIDAFGRLRVSSGTTLGDYVFSNNELPEYFSTLKYGNASITHDGDLKAMKLVCPSGTPASGAVNEGAAGFFGDIDYVAHTTDTYHHYFAGFSTEALLTVALSDAGKTGVTREWGYFDENNGYGFRVDDDSSGLKIFIRTGATGSVTETVVAQADFNKDTILDGSGLSQFTLDLTDDNLYWIDLQWLSTGRIRFGVYYRGERVIIHEHYHEGTLNGGKPHSQTGSLPISYVQYNDTSQLAESTMVAWCSSVHTEHKVDLSTVGLTQIETLSKTFDPTSIENGQTYELIGVFAPINEKLGSNGSVNRDIYIPKYIECLAYHANGDEAYVEIEAYVDPILGGGENSFDIMDSETLDTPFLVPVSSSPSVGSNVYKPTDYVLADRPKFWGTTVGQSKFASNLKGYCIQDLTNYFNDHQRGAYKNYANDGGTVVAPVTSITPGATTTVQFTSDHTLREGQPIKFSGIVGTVGTDGTNGLNWGSVRDNQYYLKITGADTAELYEDIEFTTAVDTTALVYTSGGDAEGPYGPGVYFAVLVKPLAPSVTIATDITVNISIGWREINQ
jgi:hypothetical protein